MLVVLNFTDHPVEYGLRGDLVGRKVVDSISNGKAVGEVPDRVGLEAYQGMALVLE